MSNTAIWDKVMYLQLYQTTSGYLLVISGAG